MPSRFFNIALGVWLFLSAFMWVHTSDQFTNTWLCGALVIAFSVISFRVPEVRYLNAAVAVWLLVSIWMLPMTQTFTIWNNALVALGLFVSSLIPEPAGPYLPPPGSAPPP